MNNIVVSAAALRMGGAVTIYNQFIEHLKSNIGENKYFIFINDILNAPEINGVRYYKIDLSSHKRRVKFDYKECLTILKNEHFHPDVVISLQNTGVACLRHLPHIIYYHQPHPFFSRRWNPFKKNERGLFLYKYFYLYFVKKSIGQKTQFVVQTEFIRNGLSKKLRIDDRKVHVCFPDIEIPNVNSVLEYPFPSDTYNIIYPSLYSPHKSHEVLVDALTILKKECHDTLSNIRLYFTVDKTEAPDLFDRVCMNGLESHVMFLGKLPYESVLSLYKSANLMLFPSTMETLGLPLVEAAAFGLPVFAADLAYAREVLCGYSGVQYVKAENPRAWASSLKRFIVKDNRVTYPEFKAQDRPGWAEFFNLI